VLLTSGTRLCANQSNRKRKGRVEMSLMRKSMEVFAGRWLLFPLNLLTSVLVIRVIGAEGKGILVLLMATVSILATIGNLGMPAAAIYYLRKKVHNQRTLIANFLVVAIPFSLLAWGLFFLHGEWFIRLFFKGASVNSRLIWLAFSSLPIIMLTSFISAILLGAGLSRLYAQLILSTALIDILAKFLLLVVFPFGVTGAVVANLLALGIPLVVALCQVVRNTRGYTWKISWEGISSLLHYGVRHYPATISSMTFSRAGNFLLAYFLNVQAVGYYSVAVTVYEVILSIPRAVNTLLTGEAASLEKSNSGLLVAKATRNMLLVMLCAVITLAIISPWLIPVLYGPDFVQAVIPLIILLMAGLLTGIYATIQTYFLGVNRPGLSSIFNSVACAVSPILGFILIPIIGIVGMAIALLLARFVGLLLFLFWFWRATGIPIRSVLLLTREDMASWCWRILTVLQRLRLVPKKVVGR